MAMPSVVKAQEAVIAVYPAEVIIPEEDIGKTFEINVTIRDVTNLWAWKVRVTWDPAVLTCTQVTEGPFLSDVGGTFWMEPPIQVGEIPDLSNVLLEPAGATGDGTLATMTFSADAPGVTNVVLSETELIDWAGGNEEPIQHDAEPGTVTVIPEFPASMILPLFLVTTAIIAIMAKVAWSRRRRGYVNVP